MSELVETASGDLLVKFDRLLPGHLAEERNKIRVSKDANQINLHAIFGSILCRLEDSTVITIAPPVEELEWSVEPISAIKYHTVDLNGKVSEEKGHGIPRSNLAPFFRVVFSRGNSFLDSSADRAIQQVATAFRNEHNVIFEPFAGMRPETV